MSKKIKNIRALEILDSRGDPTLEVTVLLEDGTTAKASVPSGASTGSYEACELRDNDSKRYEGKGVQKAVQNVCTAINDALVGTDVTEQRKIDERMIEIDGTDNKCCLGANATVGVSLAVARTAAIAAGIPLYEHLRNLSGFKDSKYVLPVPCINVVNGGKHASTNLDLQEFWIIPRAAKTFAERLRQGSEIFHNLGAIFKERGMDTDVGNEGGYAPEFESHTQVYDLIIEAIGRAGYLAGKEVALGMDAGASVFFSMKKQVYVMNLEHRSFTNEELMKYYMDLIRRYPIIAIEDALAEEEWDAWKAFHSQLKQHDPAIRLIGDDLFVTNMKRLQKGIEENSANSILIKPNQIGTVTETLDCIMMAKANKFNTVISHRSGETNDSFIADLAVAVNSEFIKTGSTARGERLAKYNRLLEIEHELYA